MGRARATGAKTIRLSAATKLGSRFSRIIPLRVYPGVTSGECYPPSLRSTAVILIGGDGNRGEIPTVMRARQIRNFHVVVEEISSTTGDFYYPLREGSKRGFERGSASLILLITPCSLASTST